jgi:predicted nucleic acid-binding Zn ribbon protein
MENEVIYPPTPRTPKCYIVEGPRPDCIECGTPVSLDHDPFCSEHCAESFFQGYQR